VTFRARLALVSAAAVALTVILASVLVFFLIRDQLQSEVDRSLRATADDIAQQPPDRVGKALFHLRGGELGGAVGYPQVVQVTGSPLRPPGAAVALPVNRHVREVAAGSRESFLSDATVEGTHVRMITFPYAPGFAIQVARPLSEVDNAIERTRTILLLISVGGIAIAAALGLLVSGAALRPIRRLTTATETVTETGDLSERIEVRGRDELSRLASRFNTMLGALEESARAQRQLVADASHELRTPLTSLRTNIEVLASERPLPPGERERLLADVLEQLEEMTTLIAELIELARSEQQTAAAEDVRLDMLAAGAVERTRRNRPGVKFRTDFDDSVVYGVPATLERAVSNLIDNAAKWSPPGGEVEVTVRDGELVVRDHGPGIDDEDLPYVFDRFYRARSARGMPGSGLGLAIVRQVARAHGGDVVAERAPDGGTVMRLWLNGAAKS
jgi:two-component system sensor histidine kinase MprB